MNRTPLKQRSRQSIFTRALELKRTLFYSRTSPFKHPSGINSATPTCLRTRKQTLAWCFEVSKAFRFSFREKSIANCLVSAHRWNVHGFQPISVCVLWKAFFIACLCCESTEVNAISGFSFIPGSKQNPGNAFADVT